MYFDFAYKFKISWPNYLFLWCLFELKNRFKKEYLEMVENIYLETVQSVLDESLLNYRQ